jgi:hypothetical protein
LPPFLPDICAVFAKRWAEPAEFPANCEFYEEIRSFGVMETISEPKTAVPQPLFQYLAVTSDLPIQVNSPRGRSLNSKDHGTFELIWRAAPAKRK